MNKRIVSRVMMLAVAVLTFLASSTAASACFWGSYQPQEPKSLSDK